VQHSSRMVSPLTGGAEEELRRFKEELILAIKRADEAFRDDPTRSSLNSATFRKARMADVKVTALRRRIAEMERAAQPLPPAGGPT
jgi:hypothetical protein